MPLHTPDLTPLWLSLQVATTATLLILPPGLFVAWRLAHGRTFRGKLLLELLTTLPLVLPPTVVGYGLLMTLGRGTTFGRWLNDRVGIRLIFTWQGAALAAAVMAAPLFIRTATTAFADIDADLLDAGRNLGASEAALLTRVMIPLAYRGLLAGLVLAFARALGEFGATLMVAGSIPARTQTLPLALYDNWQAGANHEALLYALMLMVIAFLLLSLVGLFQRQVFTRRGSR